MFYFYEKSLHPITLKIFLSKKCFHFRKSDFEAHNPPKLFANTSSTSLSSLVHKTLSQTPDVKNPSNFSYKGISLPKVLVDFFVMTTDVSDKKEERKDFRKRGSHSFSEMEQVKELGKRLLFI